MENIRPGMMSEDMEAWLSDSARKAGDTVAISPEEDGYSYVLYYLSEGDPFWMVSAKNTLLGTAMEAYMEEITADISIEDPKENLKYLYISENETDNNSSTDSETGSDAADGSEAPEGSDTAAGTDADAASNTDAANNAAGSSGAQ